MVLRIALLPRWLCWCGAMWGKGQVALRFGLRASCSPAFFGGAILLACSCACGHQVGACGSLLLAGVFRRRPHNWHAPVPAGTRLGPAGPTCPDLCVNCSSAANSAQNCVLLLWWRRWCRVPLRQICGSRGHVAQRPGRIEVRPAGQLLAGTPVGGAFQLACPRACGHQDWGLRAPAACRSPSGGILITGMLLCLRALG